MRAHRASVLQRNRKATSKIESLQNQPINFVRVPADPKRTGHRCCPMPAHRATILRQNKNETDFVQVPGVCQSASNPYKVASCSQSRSIFHALISEDAELQKQKFVPLCLPRRNIKYSEHCDNYIKHVASEGQC